MHASLAGDTYGLLSGDCIESGGLEDWCIKKALNTMWDKDKKCACLHFNGSTRSANMKNPEINDTSSLLSLLFEGISLSQQKGIFNIFC